MHRASLGIFSLAGLARLEVDEEAGTSDRSSIARLWPRHVVTQRHWASQSSVLCPPEKTRVPGAFFRRASYA